MQRKAWEKDSCCSEHRSERAKDKIIKINLIQGRNERAVLGVFLMYWEPVMFFSLYRLLVLEFGYCLMVPWLFCFFVIRHPWVWQALTPRMSQFWGFLHMFIPDMNHQGRASVPAVLGESQKQIWMMKTILHHNIQTSVKVSVVILIFTAQLVE